MNSFVNCAGDHATTDGILRSELAAAGIPTIQEHEGKPADFLADLLRSTSGEVKTSVIGVLHGWEFKRAWNYWMGTGPGIENAAAERLHAAHGRKVRVDGDAGCPSPSERFEGLAVGCYHIDTAEGLKALADTIRSLAVLKPEDEKERAYAPAPERIQQAQEQSLLPLGRYQEAHPPQSPFVARRVATVPGNPSWRFMIAEERTADLGYGLDREDQLSEQGISGAIEDSKNLAHALMEAISPALSLRNLRDLRDVVDREIHEWEQERKNNLLFDLTAK